MLFYRCVKILDSGVNLLDSSILIFICFGGAYMLIIACFRFFDQ